jgi:tetratricopeptide (TPR) repeat protein
MRGLAHWPENKALLLMKAEAEAANFPALAIPTVKQICEMDANDIDSANKLAGLYVQANDFNSAIDVLKRQISKCNRSEDVCRCSINLALTLYEKGDKAEGRALLSKTARQFGNRSEVLIGQVKIWLGELKYEEIKTNVIVWQGEHREDWQTVNEIVNILMKSDMRSTMSAEIAEIILKENVRLNPANVDCMHVYGSLLQLDKRNSEACKIYWTILKVNPDDVVAMNNLAWILADEKNEYQNALVIADKAVELSPNYADLLDTRGVINYKLGNFNQAIDDLKRCVSLYSEMTSFHTASCFHLGQTYVMTANKAKAEEYLSLAVKNNLRTGGLSQANLGQAERLLSQLSSE